MVKRVMLDVLLIIVGLFIVYIFLCFYLYFNQDSYIFFPEKRITAIPKTYRMEYEDIFVKTSDGVEINVWYIPQKDSPLIIHCNGNGGNLSDRVEKFFLLHNLGFAVIGFDYRGYGKSGGKPSEDGFYEDLIGVVKLSEERGYKTNGTILYGESIGGGVALQIATEKDFSFLILESTFTSIQDMARIYYKIFPTSILLKSKFDNLSKIKKIKTPVVIMHSKEDEIVPYFMGRKLYENAKEPKLFLELEKGHNDGGIIVSKDAIKELKNFLERRGKFKYSDIM